MKALLDSPPLGESKPLAKADGSLLSAMYRLLLQQDKDNSADQVFTFIEKSFALGTNPLRFVPFETGGEEPTQEPRLSTVDLILEQFAYLMSINSPNNQSILVDRTRRFLDLAFAHGSLKNDYLVLLCVMILKIGGG